MWEAWQKRRVPELLLSQPQNYFFSFFAMLNLFSKLNFTQSQNCRLQNNADLNIVFLRRYLGANTGNWQPRLVVIEAGGSYCVFFLSVLTELGSVGIVYVFFAKKKAEKDAGSITLCHWWNSKIMLQVNSGHLTDSLFNERGLEGGSLQISSEIIRNDVQKHQLPI